MKATILTPDGELTLWKTPYNHDVDQEAQRVALVCKDKSLTQQSFKDQTDINVIIDKMIKTGISPEIPVPVYADLSTIDDFHTMQNRLAEAKALFYQLTPALRASYRNDPGAWIQDVNERLAQGDLEPLREMGLDLKSLDAQIESLAAKAAEQKGGTTPGAPAPEPPKQEAQPPAT